MIPPSKQENNLKILFTKVFTLFYFLQDKSNNMHSYQKIEK